MPLRALRPGRSDRDLKRRSTLDPGNFFRRGDRDKSSENLSATRIAVSEDGGRPLSTDVARPSTSHDDSPPSPPVQESTPNTRRFSMMRFRHASDPQLSSKAKEHAARDAAPPVPAMPNAEPPAIITTAPTVIEQDENQENAAPKKRGRLQQFTLRRRSFDPSIVDRPNTLRKSMDKKRRPLGFKKSHGNLIEENERLSMSQQRPETLAEPRESVESTTALAPPSLARASESSRSDGSSGGHVSFEQTARPQHPPRLGSGRFGFGRRKPRASLFPLPMKIDPPRFPDTAPATPRVSTGGVSSGSPPQSPTESPPLTARRLNHGEPGTQTPPMPSASQVALAATSLNLASAGAGALFRNDSTKSIPKSVRSARSPRAAAPMRLGLRGRSSTMGSLGGHSDDATSPTPPNGPSGRNSTSTTAGRSSFSNLFGLSSRFRQNSGPDSPRYGSPAHGFLGNSALSSHQNSFNISRETLVLPEREEGETPGRYLERIEANNVDKSVIASFLSKTDDAFLLSVLRSYMRRFAFFGDPLDIAIRKLLMQIELPKETQQIDRVLQGFADRYHECNPGIYLNTDKAYFISFSIIILHTDVFNKNNKRKMQRPDYIKNSSCEGVSDDVLGCFYDNIVYTPFIHIEDEVDLKNISSKKSKRTAVLKGPMNDPARKAAKEPIDPYTLIFEGKLDALRPTLRDVMNLDDPYNDIGTAANLDTKNIYKLFSRYGVIQIVSSRSRPEAFMSEAAQENPLGTSVGIVEMPVTKVGILWRKDTKRKKARSPWQEWGAVLTRSGLSLFRNSSWTRNLMSQHEQHLKRGETGPVLFQPPLENFKQDHIIPMDGAVALVDNTYRKHKHSFVMFTKAGEETFLADSEKDLNEWLGVLNYTAAFETLGVRSRGMIGGLYEGQRNRGIRRLDSSQSSKSIPTSTGEVTIQSGRIDSQFAQQMMNARKELMQVRIAESEEKLATAIRELEARLRDARHLQILAPIQPKTRELVIHAAGRLAAKLKWSRIEIWRMKCHRDILAQELEDEKQGAAEKQARIDRISESAQPPLPPLSQQQSHRASKISGLARLTSKTSSLTSGQKPPLSPGASSARPGTKSSRGSDFGVDEAFKTPPETSRQYSPTDPSAQFHVPPLNFSPHTSDRRSSFASSSAQSPRLFPHDKRPSISTMGGGTVDSDSDSDDHSRYTTPPPIESDSIEPKTPEIPSLDGLHRDPATESENEQTFASLTGSPASRAKHRRSLHRTLRESHGSSSHRRSQKGRDSASTIVSDDTPESDRLTRGHGSFTVHGKKASVIQFGSDWHNTTAEERLKTKKQLQEAQGAASADERDGNSIVSNGTSMSPGADGNEENTPRRLAAEVSKQRHVSAQTITPSNYRESLKEQHSDDDGASEMSDIEEESPTTTKERISAEPATQEKETSFSIANLNPLPSSPQATGT
ncbi:protein transport protein sec73 [Cucurbitaria berberidis CBS 394.84]|uniref:Protein transport protein sec73 n=1 Tax=Cucurbitaria berberidis CBS 394.84 TaxID=1168544 RepID=A0A9P4GLB0_9PLEO|nr:protein transport protein sec73 [Cucurbitaria berberidis CBS 394.84]KAF1847332.1 protein transport protein sec73 [Cucurbitaria berberidis CBS 394.84]